MREPFELATLKHLSYARMKIFSNRDLRIYEASLFENMVKYT